MLHLSLYNIVRELYLSPAAKIQILVCGDLHAHEHTKQIKERECAHGFGGRPGLCNLSKPQFLQP